MGPRQIVAQGPRPLNPSFRFLKHYLDPQMLENHHIYQTVFAPVQQAECQNRLQKKYGALKKRFENCCTSFETSNAASISLLHFLTDELAVAEQMITLAY
jgi:hypothetical protein